MKGVIFAIILFLICYPFTSFNAITWQFFTLEEPKLFEDYLDIEVDSNGNIHIIYGGQGLYYAHFDGSSQNTQTVIPIGLDRISTAIDSNGRMHVVYLKTNNNDTGSLYYITNINGQWSQPELIANIPDTFFMHIGIDVDSNDKPHVVYSHRDPDTLSWKIFYTRKMANQSWSQPENLSNSTGWVYDVDIKVLQTNVYIFYVIEDTGNYSLYSINNTSGSWSAPTTIDTGTYISDVSTHKDSNNNIHITYKHDDNNNVKSIKYVQYSNINNTFSTPEIVISSQDYPSIVIINYTDIYTDSNGTPYIIFSARDSLSPYAFSRGYLFKKDNNNGNWLNFQSTPAYRGYLPVSIAVAPNTNDVIYGYIDSGLKLSIFEYSNNNEIEIYTDKARGIPRYISIEVDTNNQAHIAFYDQLTYDIVYMQPNSNGVNREIIFNAKDWGGYISMELDSNNMPHLIFLEDSIDYSSARLRYASKDPNSGWIVERITTGYISILNDLSLDINNQPHTIFLDALYGNIKYYYKDQYWRQGSIQIQPSYQINDIALSMDNNNNLHIVYTKGTVINYATNNNGNNWIEESIDVSNNSNHNYYLAYIEIDSNNDIHVLYNSFFTDIYLSNGFLKYGYKSGNQWSIETITSNTNGLVPISLRIDNGNVPHIAFFDADTGELKYATKHANGWAIETIYQNGGGYYEYTDIAIDANGNIHMVLFDFNQYKLIYGVGVSNYTGDAGPIDTPLSDDDDDNLFGCGGGAPIGYMSLSVPSAIFLRRLLRRVRG
ncbi:MAG: hypothetical protein GXO18_01760 [Aquificae bacterium]|nr:hypothetical protein [Aquificota bacterium]